jgi:hypothetical protein
MIFNEFRGVCSRPDFVMRTATPCRSSIRFSRARFALAGRTIQYRRRVRAQRPDVMTFARRKEQPLILFRQKSATNRLRFATPRSITHAQMTPPVRLIPAARGTRTLRHGAAGGDHIVNQRTVAPEYFCVFTANARSNSPGFSSDKKAEARLAVFWQPRFQFQL